MSDISTLTELFGGAEGDGTKRDSLAGVIEKGATEKLKTKFDPIVMENVEELKREIRMLVRQRILFSTDGSVKLKKDEKDKETEINSLPTLNEYLKDITAVDKLTYIKDLASATFDSNLKEMYDKLTTKQEVIVKFEETLETADMKLNKEGVAAYTKAKEENVDVLKTFTKNILEDVGNNKSNMYIMEDIPSSKVEITRRETTDAELQDAVIFLINVTNMASAGISVKEFDDNEWDDDDYDQDAEVDGVRAAVARLKADPDFKAYLGAIATSLGLFDNLTPEGKNIINNANDPKAAGDLITNMVLGKNDKNIKKTKKPTTIDPINEFNKIYSNAKNKTYASKKSVNVYPLVLYKLIQNKTPDAVIEDATLLLEGLNKQFTPKYLESIKGKKKWEASTGVAVELTKILRGEKSDAITDIAVPKPQSDDTRPENVSKYLETIEYTLLKTTATDAKTKKYITDKDQLDKIIKDALNKADTTDDVQQMAIQIITETGNKPSPELSSPKTDYTKEKMIKYVTNPIYEAITGQVGVGPVPLEVPPSDAAAAEAAAAAQAEINKLREQEKIGKTLGVSEDVLKNIREDIDELIEWQTVINTKNTSFESEWTTYKTLVDTLQESQLSAKDIETLIEAATATKNAAEDARGAATEARDAANRAADSAAPDKQPTVSTLTKEEALKEIQKIAKETYDRLATDHKNIDQQIDDKLKKALSDLETKFKQLSEKAGRPDVKPADLKEATVEAGSAAESLENRLNTNMQQLEERINVRIDKVQTNVDTVLDKAGLTAANITALLEGLTKNEEALEAEAKEKEIRKKSEDAEKDVREKEREVYTKDQQKKVVEAEKTAKDLREQLANAKKASEDATEAARLAAEEAGVGNQDATLGAITKVYISAIETAGKEQIFAIKNMKLDDMDVVIQGKILAEVNKYKDQMDALLKKINVEQTSTGAAIADLIANITKANQDLHKKIEENITKAQTDLAARVTHLENNPNIALGKSLGMSADEVNKLIVANTSNKSYTDTKIKELKTILASEKEQYVTAINKKIEDLLNTDRSGVTDATAATLKSIDERLKTIETRAPPSPSTTALTPEQLAALEANIIKKLQQSTPFLKTLSKKDLDDTIRSISKSEGISTDSNTIKRIIDLLLPTAVMAIRANRA